MEHEAERYYYLDRPRNWPETFSASFDFLQVTFRPLMRVLARLVVPWSIVPLLALALALAVSAPYLTSAIASEDIDRLRELRSPTSFAALIACGVVSYVGLILLVIRVVCVTFGFLRAYHEIRAVPDIGLVRLHARSIFMKGLRVLGVTILVGLAVGIVLIAAVAALGEGGAVVVLALVYIVLIAALLPLLGFQLVFQGAYVFEDGTLGSAVRRSFRLMRGRWWWTIGLGVVQYMLTNVLTSLLYLVGMVAVAIVFGLMAVLPADVHVAMLVSVGICTMAMILLIYCAPLILHASLCAATYFSLRVRADGGDLLQRVDSIGTMRDEGSYDDGQR